jgi:hypothetical protein
MLETARALEKTAALGAVRWAGLLDTLRRLDWLSPDVLGRARHEALDAAAGLLVVGTRLAWRLGLPPATVHRNLAVLAPPAALPLHRLAWRAADPAPGCDFAGWAAFLESRARRRRVRLPLGGLAAEPPRLTQADVDALFPTPGRERFLALLHAGGPVRSLRGAFVALRRALRRCPGSSAEVLTRWARDAWSAWSLPRLPRAAFDLLPHPFRRAVLAGMAGARRVLLLPRFRRLLAGDPLAHPDTPARIAARRDRLPAALAALRRRDFAHAGIVEQLDEPDNGPALAAEQTAWMDAVLHPTADAAWTAPGPAVQAALGRLPPGPLGEFLRFLAAEPASRISGASPPVGVRARLAPADWLATFTASGPDAQESLLLDFPVLDNLEIPELLALLSAALPHAAASSLPVIADHWLHRAQPPDVPTRLPLLAWLRDRPGLLAAATDPVALGQVLLATLAEGKTVPEVVTAVGPLLPPLVAQLVRPGAPDRGWLVFGVTAELLDAPPEADAILSSFLSALAAAGLLAEAVPDSLTAAAFERLCHAWPVPPTGAAAEQLRAATVSGREYPAWLALLERLRKARRPLPQRLRELAASGDADVQREAFRAYPDAFAEHGAALFPLPRLLRFAFGNVRVAGVVERHFPREQLVAHLGWVRQRWADAPSVAAALELATCFSLRDARFLCQLARRAKRPATPEERGRTFDHLYTTSERPKKGGGVRVITAPLPRLKRLQRRLLANGFATVPLHEAARGFRAGESVLTNATPHVGKPLVVNLDIDAFFPSTGYGLILRACRKLAAGRLSPRALFLLADLCSYRGALPTGAPTSPAIGNVVLTAADAALATAAARRGAAYTRYADDLTFSGPGDTHALIPFVKRVLGQLGYRVNRRKINLFRRGRRQMVTGLVVNDRVNWPRHLRRLLRAAVDRRSRGRTPVWQGQPLDDDRLRGLIAFLNVTRPDEAANLRARLPVLYPERRPPSPP